MLSADFNFTTDVRLGKMATFMSLLSDRKVQLYSFCYYEVLFRSSIIQEYWKSYFAVGELTSSAKHFTGERPYTCSFCPATFRCKPHVQRHEEQHKGKKRFTCGVCNHATFQRSNMKVSNGLSTEARSRKFLRMLTFLEVFDAYICYIFFLNRNSIYIK